MLLSSSDTVDTSAGTGARTVRIKGLDTNLDPVEEVLSLNGQTGVAMATNLLRVNKLLVETAGSGGQNAGDIYLGTGTITAGVPVNKFGKISVGENDALSSVCTVQAGRTGLVTGIFIGTPKQANVNVRVVVRELGKVFMTIDRFILFAQALFIPHDVPLLVPAGADIEIRSQASTGTAEISVAYGMILSR